METSLYKSRKKYRTEANRKRRKMARATKAASAKKKRASRKMRRTRRARMQKARLRKRQANTGRSECFFFDSICPTMRIASLEDSYDGVSEKEPTEISRTATWRNKPFAILLFTLLCVLLVVVVQISVAVNMPKLQVPNGWEYLGYVGVNLCLLILLLSV